jgi:hypothetical protein
VPSVYIAQIDCSDSVREKINSKHGITLDEVREAFMYPARPERVSRLTSTHEDPRAPRIAVQGSTLRGRRIQAVLYPVDEGNGIWRLGTAVPMVDQC